MSVVKVIEVLSESNKSWEDAAQKAVKEADKTIRNIRSVWVKDMNMEIDKGKIVKWRLTCKISFELDGKK